MVAYVLWEHGVAGSNPVTSTIKDALTYIERVEEMADKKIAFFEL